jgi:septum formation protein
MNSRPALVLASASPRRAELLATIGARFAIRPPQVDESTRAHEAAHDYVARVARAKVEAVQEPGTVVVAADTIVVVDDEILGKPTDEDTARSMLTRLSGRAHEVLTGLAVAVTPPGPNGDRSVTHTVVTTHVWFAELTAEAIDWYVATGEPFDKAGAYGIQGRGGLFVQYLHGSYQNVVGLPLADLDELLAENGLTLLDWTN